jgi:hypothetical protein
MSHAGISEQAATRDLEALVGESMLESVPGLGASLAVTPTRVVVIRDGAERRPRTGLRAWAHGAIDARMEPPRGGNGRIVLGTGANPYAAVSLFVRASFWPMAVQTVERIRTEARRARRAASRADAERGSAFRAPKP